MADTAQMKNGQANLLEENSQPASDAEAAATSSTKWPGWPGDNVFRLIVPVIKVGSIIGRKGELIKKMCEETRARISVLEAPVGSTPDRVVSFFFFLLIKILMWSEFLLLFFKK